MENKGTENKGTPNTEKTLGTEKGTPQSSTTTTSGTTPGQMGNRPLGQTTGTQATGSATQRSRYQPEQNRSDEWDEMKERGAEMADKAKQVVSDAYERTSRNLNEGYKQAVDYGREHPGQTALICFGLGVGIGLWLGSNVSPRSRASRIVPPVMNAVSDIVSEIFR
jgi:ElaB/YqjD/DUF883 family membrane-anchored ribosome-binding protein